jgi:hypothetical protein
MSITISTKVPEELADRIDEAREEGENTSACVRRLIRAGLDADDGDDAQHRAPPYLYAVFLGSLLFLAPITSPEAISGATMMGLGALLVIGAVAYANLS